MSDFFPPRKAVLLALVVTAAVAVGVALAGWLGGTGAAATAAIGAVGVLAMAAREVPSVALASFVAFTAALATAADAAADNALALALLVAASIVGAMPFTVRYGPVGAALPVVVLVVGAQLHGIGPAKAGLAVLGMAAILAAVIAALRIPRMPADPVSTTIAVRHAIALAALAGVGTLIVLAEGWGHGVWIVFGLTAVLVPDPGKALGEAGARIAGTLVGAVVAAAVASVLPPGVSLVLSLPALLLAVAHAVVNDRRRFAAYSTAVVVLVAAAAVPDATWGVAITRVAFIALGAAVAAATAVLVLRADDARAP